MKPDPVSKPRIQRESRTPMTRRALLQRAGAAAALSTLSAAPLFAQTPDLQQTIRQMSVMTDSTLPERWVEPTTSLVGVILSYSEGLRDLDLGETEPATFFVAR